MPLWSKYHYQSRFQEKTRKNLSERNPSFFLKERMLKPSRKWPAKFQWKQFFKVLTKKERVFFFGFLALFLSSSIFLLTNFYLKNTEIRPAKGGTHIEGVIGQPRFINPIYANSDIDRDLVQLIFSGLMKYDEDLGIIPDLIQNYKIEEEGKVYKFYLKEEIFWHDRTPLTVDDVIFTIKTIQNPDYKSPLRANWVGVEVEKISDSAIKFELKRPYSAFLENCTVKILPKHIWQDISPENFPFTVHNLVPIGSGPYKLKKTDQEKSESLKELILKRNPLYFDKNPNISEIKFLFFDNEADLIESARKEKITGLSLSSFGNLDRNWQNYSLAMPRYFAVFFNQDKSKVLADKEVRTALNYGTNKKEIVKKILNLTEDSSLLEKAIVHSPILPKIYGFEDPQEIYDFDIEKAKNILEEAGFLEKENGLREKIIERESSFQFKTRLQSGSQGTEVRELQKCLAKFPDIYPQGKTTGYFGRETKEAVIKFQEEYAEEILKPWGFTEGTGIVGETTRTKLNEVCFGPPEETLLLKFNLVTVDQPQLVKVAEEIKRQWRLLGVELEIKKISIFQLEQDFIKPRNYESLLFGEVLGAIPDFLPFWHSSQKRDPGLNLALYDNSEVDKLLEKIRKSLDPQFRAENLALFQDILIPETPVVFLYSPDYIYLVSKEIKGIAAQKIIDPSKRFVKIEDWYIKTKRVWK